MSLLNLQQTSHVQILNREAVVLAHETRRGLVMKLVSSIRDASVNQSDAKFRLAPSSAPSLLSIELPLSSAKYLDVRLKKTRMVDLLSARQHGKMLQTDVDAYAVLARQNFRLFSDVDNEVSPPAT